MGRRELAEILVDIRKEIPGFKKEELIEYTKWAIPKLYDELRDNVNLEQMKVKCNNQLIDKIIQEKVRYRISKNIDNISMQYIELYDTVKKDEDLLIKVYVSIYFYDNVSNNLEWQFAQDRHVNDIWVVTFKGKSSERFEDGNCDNCGAVMEYNETKSIYNCAYCGNVVTTQRLYRDWEIADIEVNP